MILLDVNGVEDVTWTTGNVVSILIALGGLVSAFVKMKVDKVKMEGHMNVLGEKIEDQKADMLGAKNSRHAIRKEFAEADKEILNELKEDRTNNAQEFKEINKQLGDINMGVGELKGLLTKKN